MNLIQFQYNNKMLNTEGKKRLKTDYQQGKGKHYRMLNKCLKYNNSSQFFKQIIGLNVTYIKILVSIMHVKNEIE